MSRFLECFWQFICEQWGRRRGLNPLLCFHYFLSSSLIFPPQLELYRKHYSARNYREPRKISPDGRLKRSALDIRGQELIETTLKVSFLISPPFPRSVLFCRGGRVQIDAINNIKWRQYINSKLLKLASISELSKVQFWWCTFLHCNLQPFNQYLICLH